MSYSKMLAESVEKLLVQLVGKGFYKYEVKLSSLCLMCDYGFHRMLFNSIKFVLAEKVTYRKLSC